MKRFFILGPQVNERGSNNLLMKTTSLIIENTERKCRKDSYQLCRTLFSRALRSCDSLAAIGPCAMDKKMGKAPASPVLFDSSFSGNQTRYKAGHALDGTDLTGIDITSGIYRDTLTH